MAAVVARGLTVTRGGREVLHGLDFEIAAGEVLGLLGPSGCGKSTLLRSIVGVQAGIRGSLEVLGEPAGAKGLRGRIGPRRSLHRGERDLQKSPAARPRG